MPATPEPLDQFGRTAAERAALFAATHAHQAHYNELRRLGDSAPNLSGPTASPVAPHRSTVAEGVATKTELGSVAVAASPGAAGRLSAVADRRSTFSAAGPQAATQPGLRRSSAPGGELKTNNRAGGGIPGSAAWAAATARKQV